MYMYLMMYVCMYVCMYVSTCTSCYILYTLMQWNRWFANSECNKRLVTRQFAMQMNALHQVDVTSELLHSWWFAHAQSNNKTINLWLFV